MGILDLIRYLVLAGFGLSAAAAVGSWAVTTRRIRPFSGPARTIRSATDPLVNPIERWLVRRGGNPVHAPWWLLGLATGVGIAVILGSQFVYGIVAASADALRTGPRGVIRLIVGFAGQVMVLALIARVVGTWIGMGRYHRWMRYAYYLTDWIVKPLQRIVPPIGMIDITPIVAWLVVLIGTRVLLGIV